MNCKECYFNYQEQGDKYPRCHFERRTCWDIPPCEQEEIDIELRIAQEELEDIKRAILEEL